jgi:hypothetical protein
VANRHHRRNSWWDTVRNHERRIRPIVSILTRRSHNVGKQPSGK